MTTQTEALKLALEAFEAIPEEIEGWIPDKCTDAVIAIKEALAQPDCDLKPKCFADFQPNHEHDRKCQWCAVDTECKTGAAQPEQRSVSEHLKERSSDEPVVYKKARIHWLCQEWKEDHLSDINFVESIIAECLTPPQRDSSATPRKPLTDEEIYEAINNEVFNLLDFVFEFGTQSKGIKNMVNAIARAIEAAHGIVGDTHE